MIPADPTGPDWPATIVERIIGLLLAAPPRAAGTRVLAIDGRSGAGKTSLSAAVSAALDPPAPVVHLEDLYAGWDGLGAGPERLLEWVLRPLAAGRPVRYRRYDWYRDEYAEWVDVPIQPTQPTQSVPVPVLIVEGVGAGARPGAELLSLLVYLDTPEPIRFERAMARDGETYRPHWDRWARQETRLLADDDPRGRADLVLGAQDPGVP